MNGGTIAGHVVTALVTLALAVALLGERRDSGRSGAVMAQIPGRNPSPPPPPRPAIPAAAPVSVPPLTAEVLKQADADEQVNIRVYAAVNHGVVNITTTTEVQSFFGDEVSSGTGSGFVLDGQGHILTNFHVVQGADSLR